MKSSLCKLQNYFPASCIKRTREMIIPPFMQMICPFKELMETTVCGMYVCVCSYGCLYLRGEREREREREFVCGPHCKLTSKRAGKRRKSR